MADNRAGESREGECCPRFDPAPWEDHLRTWNDKPFIVDTVPQFLHIPLPGTLPRVMGRLWRAAQEQGAAPELSEFLALAYDPSPWRSEIHIAVTKPVAGVKNVTLSGTYYSRVFDGPYNAVPRYIRELDASIRSQGREARKYFFYYTTCPKCAKKYGHNYIVALAQV